MAKRKQSQLPTRNDAPEGARLSLANAERHFSCAQELARHNYWGPASALLVLAMEEAQKAYMLSLLAIGVSAETIPLRRLLSDHSTRHALAFWDLFALVNLDIMRRQKSRTEAEYGLAPNEAPSEDARQRWFESVADEVEALASATPETHGDLAAFEWIGSANQRKNQGLYVDFREGAWITPASIDERLYSRGRDATRRLLDTRQAFAKYLLSAGDGEKAAILDGIESTRRRMAEDPSLASISGVLSMISSAL